MKTLTTNPTINPTFSHFGKNKLLFAENSFFHEGKLNRECHRTFVSNILIKRKNRWEPLFNIHKEWYGLHAWHVYLVEKNTTYLGEKISGDGVATLIQAISIAKLKYLELELEEGEYMVADKSFSVMEPYGRTTEKLKSSKEDYCVETSFSEIPDELQLPDLKEHKAGKTYSYDAFARIPVYGNEKVKDNKNLYEKVVECLKKEDYQNALRWASCVVCGTSLEERKMFDAASQLIFVKYLYRNDPTPNYTSLGYTVEDGEEIITRAIEAVKKLYLFDENYKPARHPIYSIYEVISE